MKLYLENRVQVNQIHVFENYPSTFIIIMINQLLNKENE